MPKTAVIVLSDPKGGEEALGRLFNALAATLDFKDRREDVVLVFQGTGTRWAAELVKPGHPVHALYSAVEDKVAGVSNGCSVFFGAKADATASGFKLIGDNPVPGTDGLPSLAQLVADGYRILTF
jgi:hypothetical protein